MTKINSKEKFITEFKEEFSNQIEHFEEKSLDGIEETFYYIELKQDVGSSDFINSTLPFVNSNSDFEESFDLWIREKGQDVGVSVSLTINGDYSDSDRDSWEEDEDDEDFDPIHIEVDGRILEVFDIGSYGQFSVMENDEPLLDIYVSASEGITQWSTKDDFDQEFVNKIGEAIENAEM